MLYKWYIYRYENDSKILENQYVIQITKKKIKSSYSHKKYTNLHSYTISLKHFKPCVMFFITYAQEEDSQNQDPDSLHCYRISATVFLFLSVCVKCQGGLNKCRLPKTRTYRENECSLVFWVGSMDFYWFR